jgi:uncharacterized protein
MPASTPFPPPSKPTALLDLTDEEFAELDDLLAATPEPLTPCDAVMLDGFLCAVLVQPLLLEPDTWLPHVFDFDGELLPDDVDPVWLARTKALILRRYQALNHAMVEDGWFNPLILEFDEEHPRVLPPDSEQTGEVDPLAGLSEISQALMPWVAGFHHASTCFPDLEEMADDSVTLALARLYRHLPPETDEDRALIATLDVEHPLADLEAAIEDLVVTVADLSDLTRESRYKVETFIRDVPKVGRNDACPCGSGKKFKTCHGA